MEITTLDRLKAVKQTEVIELPAFIDGTPFVAEVKKPNMMQLMTSGKIPNQLMTSAMTMFNGKTNQLTNKVNENDIGSLKELVGLLDILTEYCLVNPSLKDIKEIGIELTQEQMMGVLMYTQGGIESLKSFHMQS
jgi:hypothetical protein